MTECFEVCLLTAKLCLQALVQRFDTRKVRMHFEFFVLQDVVCTAELDVFLRQIIVVYQHFSDLVGFSGVLSVVRIIAFKQESVIAALDDWCRVPLDFVGDPSKLLFVKLMVSCWAPSICEVTCTAKSD
jgi:hypothetical protein